MTEEEARARLSALIPVPRETGEALERFVEFLKGEAVRQNLVAASTLDRIWLRHILDSAQLLPLAPSEARTWIDMGSGAGFPGLIVAALGQAHVSLVESRRLRVEFLHRAAACLGIEERVEILGVRAESIVDRRFDVISARAFAPLERLLPLGVRFVSEKTRWLLPKGRGALMELDAVRGSWQGAFRVEPSITDPDAHIIVAEQVRPRNSR